MPSNNNSPESGGDDFSFAFNNSSFSDRVLRLKIVSEPHQVKHHKESSSPTSTSPAIFPSTDPKYDTDSSSPTSISPAIFPSTDTKYDTDSYSPNSNPVAIISSVDPLKSFLSDSLSPTSTSAAIFSSPDPFNNFLSDYNHNANTTSCGIDSSSAESVRTVNVSSAVLASKSPYFYRVFSSKQSDITIELSSSEEDAFIDLLNFIYGGTLKSETTPALLDVLVVANKFEVPSCLHHCIDVLSPSITVESALLLLGLPFHVRIVDVVQPLIHTAKEFLNKHFAQIEEFQGEIPLATVLEVLSSDNLEATSEDAIFDFIMKWATEHYPDEKQRRKVLNDKLTNCIRFPYLSNEKLKEIFFNKDLDCADTLNLILEALIFREGIHESENYTHLESFCERPYIHKPINVVHFDKPHRECIVFLNIKKDECLTLNEKDFLVSQVINYEGKQFVLKAYTTQTEEGLPKSFGLCLQMVSKGEVTVDYMFFARSKPSDNFSQMARGIQKLDYKGLAGAPNLFGMGWPEFVSDNNKYFIDNVMHLKVLLAERNNFPFGIKILQPDHFCMTDLDHLSLTDCS